MKVSNNSKPKFWVSQAISLPSLIVYLTICLTLLISPLAFAQEGEIEEVIVKGNVLYSDQVNALKTPVEVIDVPQTVSIVTDEDIRKQKVVANLNENDYHYHSQRIGLLIL